MTTSEITDTGTVITTEGAIREIVGVAARQVPGVADLGGGAARVLGALRERIPGAARSEGQGVSVELGETQVAVDLDVVARYGVPVTELAHLVRGTVAAAIRRATDLEITEINVEITDITA
ncbi:Asp23/Gls24 family envelope stress response protein [Pseudonocardiaceae bacterium YIM PH 21723]|nr:Asp23/Gls24 family envelope stress response protein [Pseudonocardiaceae bacterium YIM PH 21723]